MNKTETEFIELKEIASSITSVIWKANTDENLNLSNTYVSPVADEILELPPGTINNSWEKYFSYVNPDDLPKAIITLKKSLTQTDKVLSCDYRMIKNNGETIWLQSAGRCKKEDGKMQLFGHSIDITERKKLEIELIDHKENLELKIKEQTKILEKNLKKTEEQSKYKTVFLNNVSHEIRTPLNAILGFSNLLLQREDICEQAKKFAVIINESGENLLKVVSDIIEISDAQTGQLELNKEEFCVNQLLGDIFEKYFGHEILAEKYILLKKIDATESLTIFADRHYITKVFDYLIDNAMKFAQEGTVTFGYDTQKKTFFVSNTGTEIPTEKYEQIFEPFRQADEGLNRAFGGTGLGLSIAKAVVNKHNGKIWINQNDNLITFYFTLNTLK